MRILGVDPGMRATGYGVIDVVPGMLRAARLIETGTIEPRTTLALPDRIHKIHHHITEIVQQHRPGVMVLEKLYAHYRHPVTACKLGHVRGVICLVCALCRIELVEHSVKRIRKTLVGDGGASKVQTREVVAHLLKIDPGQLTLDASDALALALGYANMQRMPLMGAAG